MSGGGVLCRFCDVHKVLFQYNFKGNHNQTIIFDFGLSGQPSDYRAAARTANQPAADGTDSRIFRA
jgi:hypothetical protein